jgi:hypothetical protein
MEIYEIYAGDSYSFNANWTLIHKEILDLEILHEEFLKLNIPYDTRNFGQTKIFVKWLISEKGFIMPGTYSIHLEN